MVLLETGSLVRSMDPCILVIFGATGDLTARKLIPALYNMMIAGQLPSHWACVGVARRPKTDAEFREEMRQAITSFSRTQPIDPAVAASFIERLFYHQTEFHEGAGYRSLKDRLDKIDAQLGTRGNRIFYFSVQPSFFGQVASQLHKGGLLYPPHKETFSRVVIEKPFGRDVDSALALQEELTQFLDESQIYRIDHYLGKETVQNILVFRFANSLFESQWNSRYIETVQITVAEEIGVGTRGAFWEEAGMLRDIVQNHLMQLLCLVAMEPPVSLGADDIRNEKVKVLKAARAMTFHDAVRGQYAPGYIDGQSVKGYRDEDRVSKESLIETFVALKLSIDNWRWHGTHFYLRAGKRLPKRVTEIAVTFKDPPAVLFQSLGKENPPNVLIIRIQPDEGISLRMNCKVPGPGIQIFPVKMDFRYSSYFGTTPPEAYERLIGDAILGDGTLFAREDEVLASWKLLTPLLKHWATATEIPFYPAGTWGPQAADSLFSGWRQM